jgi:hypothetical protein
MVPDQVLVQYCLVGRKPWGNMNKYFQPNVSIHIHSSNYNAGVWHIGYVREAHGRASLVTLAYWGRCLGGAKVVRRLLSQPVVRTSSYQRVKSPGCTNARTPHTTSFIDTKASHTSTGSTHLPLHLHLNTTRTTSTHAIAQQDRRIVKTSHGKQIDTISIYLLGNISHSLISTTLYENELNRQHTGGISGLQE